MHHLIIKFFLWTVLLNSHWEQLKKDCLKKACLLLTPIGLSQPMNNFSSSHKTKTSIQTKKKPFKLKCENVKTMIHKSKEQKFTLIMLEPYTTIWLWYLLSRPRQPERTQSKWHLYWLSKLQSDKLTNIPASHHNCIINMCLPLNNILQHVHFKQAQWSSANSILTCHVLTNNSYCSRQLEYYGKQNYGTWKGFSRKHAGRKTNDK